MNQIIDAGVHDPSRSVFKASANDKAQAWRITCQNPQGCSLYTQDNSCLLKAPMGSCKFGRKTGQTGPTKRARSFYTWIGDEQRKVKELGVSLKALKAYNRIVHTNGHYYLPYAFMSIGADQGAPLSSRWVPQEDMTDALLAQIVQAQPRDLYGHVLRRYQEEEVPKFLSDVHQHHPDLFARLPAEAKARVAHMSPVGRTADITTCLPGTYTFGTQSWDWDGTVLTCAHMLFQPVKGDLRVELRPKKGEPVVITHDAQVGPHTVFID